MSLDYVTVSLETFWPLGDACGLKFSRQQTESLLLTASVEEGAVCKHSLLSGKGDCDHLLPVLPDDHQPSET